MTISATDRLTTKQQTDLNRMNEASRKAGGLGARLDGMEYGSAIVPATGTLVGVSPVKYSVAPALQTATSVHAAITLTTGVQIVTTAITQPDVPRIVTVKGNDGNVTGNCVVIGTDITGAACTDTIALNGSTEALGVKAFKTITSVQVPVYAVAGTETVSFGRGIKIGFPVAIPNTGLVIAKSFNGTVDAGTVTAGATAALSIYSVAGTMDGAKIVDLYFIA